jgi:hypothetical protein
VKNLFCFFNLLFSTPVLLTSNPSQQFSAPFKAGNSRQAQTCNIPYFVNTKKLQHETGLHTSFGEMRVLVTLIHDVPF